MFMSISRHFEKYNAVITVVAPCKYVSPQMWSPGGAHWGWNEIGGRNGVGNEERDKAVPCNACSLMFRQRKVSEQQKWRLQISWLSECGNATDTPWYYCGFLCLHGATYFMNCICVIPAWTMFSHNFIMFVCAIVWVCMHAMSQCG